MEQILKARLSVIILLMFLSFSSFASSSQTSDVKIEPPFWWEGMSHPELQLMVYAPEIGKCEVKIKYPGVEIIKVHSVENPNYLFIDLSIAKAKAGTFTINFKGENNKNYEYKYELKKRNEGSAKRQGFTPSDIIYLLMPDRFANGDKSNDDVNSMIEKSDRSKPLGRHGGDIKGITEHLNYIKELGATAIWINPLLENNNQALTYHGYAITDFYKVDPRFGTNKEYVDMVQKSHSQGMKVIMDMVFNHCGINHWIIKDIPMKNWVHEFPAFTRSNFRAESLTDPHAAEIDRNTMLQGWFDTNMPDLDQRNDFVANYLIQNSIWWIEYSGIDGIRMDTQPYSYKAFLSAWAKRVFDEYPDFNIVGEAWIQKESMTSYYQKDSKLGEGYNSYIPSITDFPLQSAINKGFTEPQGWSEGLARIYYVLAQDFVYANPYYNLIFADNHDLTRFYSSINSNFEAWKLGMTFLMTTRGIPMIYYGTEFLMEGEEHKGHGEIRKDFPGGWEGDSLNFFAGIGMSSKQKEAYNYLQKLMLWRSTNDAVKSGTLTHYIPSDGVYVYFREKGEQRVMVILNSSDESQSIETSRFAESLRGARYGKNVMTDSRFTFRGSILVEPKSELIIEINENNKYPY